MVDFFRRFHNLIFRLILLSVVIVFYVIEKDSLLLQLNEVFSFNLTTLIWLIFILEIVYRFLPTENVGVAKMYKKHFVEKEYDVIKLNKLKKQDNLRAIIMFGLFILMMSVVTTLFMLSVIDKGIVLIISMSLWMISEICVQLFCPFSYLFFKKQCCNKCRFYSWDYFLMFAPLIFIGNVFTYIIVVFSFVLLIVWELNYIKYPQRFYDISNGAIECKCCENQNCKYKNTLNKVCDKVLQAFKGDKTK